MMRMVGELNPNISMKVCNLTKGSVIVSGSSLECDLTF
jgi:hypothetical protein